MRHCRRDRAAIIGHALFAEPMRKAWLLFSQTVTVAVALLFVVATLKPQWLAAAPTPLASPPRRSCRCPRRCRASR